MMLKNPRYAALMTHNDEVVGKGEWEPILDEETHLAVTALLTDPARRSQHSVERIYVGSGVYECGECGGKLRPISNKPARSRRGKGAATSATAARPASTCPARSRCSTPSSRKGSWRC